LITAAACLLGGLILSLATVEPVAYHWWQYERLRTRWVTVWDHPTVLDTVESTLLGDHKSRFDGHLQALVNAGEVEVLKINLSQRLNTQAENRSLCYMLLDGGHRGKIVDWSVPSGSGKPGETLSCRIWCRSEHSEEWRTFFREYNAGEPDDG
jgi:hypothetical protein